MSSRSLQAKVAPYRLQRIRHGRSDWPTIGAVTRTYVSLGIGFIIRNVKYDTGGYTVAAFEFRPSHKESPFLVSPILPKVLHGCASTRL